MKCNTLKKLWLMLLLLSLSIIPVFAVNEEAGTTGFANLKNVYSARAIALGQSLTGQVRNPDGLYFNPAAILNIEGKELGTTYTNSFIDTQGGQIQYLLPKNKFTAWGFAIKYMNMGSMERTEVDNNGDLISTGETFGAYDIIGSVSLAKYITDAIDLGGTLKVIYDQIDDKSASAVMVDLGMIHHPANPNVKVGISLRNIGFQTSYYSATDYKEKLPFTFAAGITYQFIPTLLGCLEIDKVTGENILAKLGLEYELNPALALRAGFRSNASEGYNGGNLAFLSGFSLGAGWNWKNCRLDYGVTSYGDLGLINQLSLSYEF